MVIYWRRNLCVWTPRIVSFQQMHLVNIFFFWKKSQRTFLKVSLDTIIMIDFIAGNVFKADVHRVEMRQFSVFYIVHRQAINDWDMSKWSRSHQ